MSTNVVPVFFALILAGGFFGINSAYSTEELTGEQYVYTYSKCTQYSSGPKGVQSCTGRWIPQHEKQAKTIVKGLFFDYESYKIVR